MKTKFLYLIYWDGQDIQDVETQKHLIVIFYPVHPVHPCEIDPT